MKQLRPLCHCLVLFLAWALMASAATKEAPLEIQSATGNLEFNPNTGFATITNGVTVTYADTVLTADTASVNQDTGEVRAGGRVMLARGGQVWRGDLLTYNFKTRQMGAESFRIGLSPFFAEGRALGADQSNNLYRAAGSYVTTDDLAEPGYRIRGRSMTLVPGEYVEMKHATLYLGDVPVFYWPYYHRQLGRHPFNFEFLPGYRSLYGPYLLTTINAAWASNLYTEFHLDYRVKRGLGVGPSVTYDLGAAGHGKFDYYYLNDHEPGTNLLTGAPLPNDRQRFMLLHDVAFDTNFTAKAFVNYQSDPQVIRDFFESEFRRNPQPGTFVEVSKQWPNYSLSLLTQPKVNDFFETVERLPDVKLTAARQQLGPVPLFYEGESSFGYFRYETNLTPRYAAWRADTFHQLVSPHTLFGWLNLTPRAGGRFTHYGEAEGPGATTQAENRWVFNTGAELSFKSSRVWRAATNALLEVNGLRHIVEPVVNYSYVPTPNKLPSQLPQFDTLSPSLRPLPIDFPRFNDIDSIDSENTVRLGLRNKLQTKRDGDLDNLVDWDVFADWRLRPRAGQQTFGDLVSALDLKPRSWLAVSSEIRYGINDVVLREANHELHLQPGTDWSFALGHRYFRADPAFGVDSEHNLITSSIYWRLNENWAVRAAHRFEARDGRLEEQHYTIYRDLRSWTGALIFRVRDERTGPTDLTVAFMLSLKAFPRFAIGHDRDESSSLLGY